MNNKEIIRAANIQSIDLLKDVLSQKLKISTLFERWGPENNFNALELLCLNGDKQMINYFCRSYEEKKIHLTSIPYCSLNQIEIGLNNQHADGAKIQGNNAFVSDLASEQILIQETINKLLRNPKIKNVTFYDILLDKGVFNILNILEQIPTAVRAGNHSVSKYLIEKAVKQGNTYGYNWLHLECLGNKIQFDKIKKADLTKKITGMMQLTPIHIAAINPDPSYLEKILKISKEFKIQDELGRKPIHYAAVSDNDKCLQYLLDNRVDPREEDKFKFTPLMLAAQYGKLSCLKTLINSCSDNVNAKNKEGNTAIHLAAQYGHLDCLIELLANKGSPVQSGQNKSEPIHLAAAYGHYQIVEYLRDKAKANINSKDKYGRTPLAMAARNGNLEILSYLLKNGADYRIGDSSGNTPMHYAAAYGFAECLLELKKAGCDQNLNNSYHLKPLQVALAKNHYYIVKKIIELPETDINYKNDEGKTPLHFVVELSAKRYKTTIFQYSQMPKNKRKEQKKNFRQSVLDLVKFFISRGANLNAPDSQGVTPFMTSIKEKQTELLSYFFEKCGPEINFRDRNGKNLLHIMIENRFHINHKRNQLFITILEKLKKEQLKQDDDQGYTPLLYMIKEFTSSTTYLYNKNLKQIILNAQLAKMEEHILKIDPNGQEQNNQNISRQSLLRDEQESIFDNQSQVAPIQPQGLIGQQVEIRTYAQFSFSIYDNQIKTIGFTQKEYKNFQDQAMIDTLKYEDQVLDLIRRFCEQGASLEEYVKENKQFSIGNSMKVETDNQYNPESKKQIQHYLFQNFPKKQFLQKLIKQLGALQLNFNQQCNNDQTPLHLFCLNSANKTIYNSEDAPTLRQEFLQYILDELQVKVDIQDSKGRTATHILAVNFEEPLLDLLLDNGGQLNIVSLDNIVPIIHHVNRQDVQTVKKLLDKKADPNFQDLKKRSPLHHAINISSSSIDSSFDMEQLLFQKGAKADIRDIFDRTPLFYCFVKIGREYERHPIDPSQTVFLLLDQKTCQGNVYDTFRRTPLHYAAMRDSVYSAGHLVNQNKLEIDGQDIDGNTPIALAFLCGHQHFVKTLIDLKAQITGLALFRDRKMLEQDYIRQQKEKNNAQNVDEELDNAASDSSQQSQFGNNQTRKALGAHNGGFDQQKKVLELGQDVQKSIIFPTRFPYIPVASSIMPDQYTYFKLAITLGWQNVAYLLIQSGFDPFIALEDSLKSQKFYLMKTLLSQAREEQVRDRKNKQGMNLFHLFAQFGQHAEQHIYEQIVSQLETKLIPNNDYDNCKRTPLHYAAKIGFTNLLYYLLEKQVSPNDFDNEQNTPYSYAVQRDYQSVFSKLNFPKWQAAGFNIKQRFQVFNKNYQLETFMYLVQEKQIEDENFLEELLKNGSDINSFNQDKESALFLSIRANNENLFKFLLAKTKKARVSHLRNEKETIFHVVVQPLPYGSYENTFILKELANSVVFGSINQRDQLRRTPLDYALRQKSGIMATLLQSLGAISGNAINNIIPAIEGAHYPAQFEIFENHALQYIQEKKNIKEQDKSMIDPRLEVDNQAKYQAGKYEILVNNGQPYSIILTKVDLLTSENVFIKIQLIHERNKDDYILFTRWGTIGTSGQYKTTLFNKPNAMNEFNTIFKIKTGNIWEEIIAGKPFQKHPKKYLLLNLQIKHNQKQLMQPFDFSRMNKYPYHGLEKNVARFLLQFCQLQLYQREFQQIRVDHEFLPFESLEKQQLQEAKDILEQLEEFVVDLEKQRKEHQLNDERIFELVTSINEGSSRYYEFIPCIDYRTEPFTPLQTLQQIRSQSLIVETLLNFELISKIFMGALKQAQIVNPLTYCFNSMQIRVQTLTKEQIEYQMVQTYVKVTSSAKISNIFAVERRNEIQRFSARFTNLSKQLLWHGSKVSNIIPILTNGLKIAPPWTYATGSMFGKGIYFTDTFEKSYEYTQDQNLIFNNIYVEEKGLYNNINQNQTYEDEEQNEIQRYRYLLLCEVATGRMKELRQPLNIMNFSDQFNGFDSIKACGTHMPDPTQQVLLEDGTILPQGKIIQNKPLNQSDRYYLKQNEYIIYDEEQVKIRYLVQIDTQSQEDKFL